MVRNKWSCRTTVLTTVAADSHVSSSVQGECVICRKTCSVMCGSCLRMKYCSRECARLDWPRHYRLCMTAVNPAPDAEERHATSTEAQIAGLLGLDGYSLLNAVHVLKMTISCTISESDIGRCTHAHIEEVVHLQQRDRVVVAVAASSLLQWPYDVWISMRAFQDADVTRENRSIATEFGPILDRPWYGPVVVLKFDGQGCEMYRDVCDTDLMVLRGFFNGEW
ncbi:hypothetical protein C8T65DRAFT_593424 [Cerioporus squamosus]|nr:hypothetical protein C8T65DRAFT_593424 [Cerioporus squamosus]